MWLVLRRHLERAGWWVLATIAGVLVTLLLESLLFVPLTVDIMIKARESGNVEVLRVWLVRESAFNGAVLGILQWLVLRRQLAKAGWWVLASTGGYVAAGYVASRVTVFLYGATLDVTLPIQQVVTSVASGPVYGAITGVALMLLLSRRANGGDATSTSTVRTGDWRRSI